jgi:hypothetical protein
MMPKKIKDLMVKVDEYTNAKGEKKARWQNVGAEMESDDGSKYLLLERWFNPAGVPDLSGKGAKSIMLWRFDVKDRDGSGQQSNAPAAAGAGQQAKDNFNDDIPF